MYIPKREIGSSMACRRRLMLSFRLSQRRQRDGGFERLDPAVRCVRSSPDVRLVLQVGSGSAPAPGGSRHWLQTALAGVIAALVATGLGWSSGRVFARVLSGVKSDGGGAAYLTANIAR